MPTQTIFALGASQISVSGGGQLSGITQGDGSHLDGLTITLNANAWEPILIDDNDATFDDNDGNQRLEGAQTFDGIAYSDNRGVEAEYRLLVQAPDGTQFTLFGFNINQGGGGASFGSIEGLAFLSTGGVNQFPPIGVPLTVVSSTEGPSNVAYDSYATPPCFTPGTLIQTPQGQVDVADLAIGDEVMTLDHGRQKIRWIGRVNLTSDDMRRDPRCRPVTIFKDAFGPGKPARQMQVSPQHRIFLDGWRAQLHFGLDELLVAATKLRNDLTVCRDNSLRPVTYIHLLFDRHEVVWSDGLPSESYYPSAGDHTAMAQELATLFPGQFGPAARFVVARPCVTDKSAVTLSDQSSRRRAAAG